MWQNQLLMHEMAKNYIRFTHCSINEPSTYVVVWQVYLVCQTTLGAVEGWSGLSIKAPFFASCVAPLHLISYFFHIEMIWI